MGTHFFIDETKAKSYVVVAVGCPDAALSPARKAIGNLVLPGQHSIHMKQESARRRREIAHSVCGLEKFGLTATVLDAGRGPDPEHIRRDRALCAVVALAVRTSATAHLVVDLDRTLLTRDSRSLAAAVRESGSTLITYSHQELRSQPLLALPDVVAWCWARGGDWRRRVASLVTDTLHV